ncbi:MAG: cobalt-precorrin 5A hydrolase [Lachnospiraceae bacterium]|nr:cobalt-precorrin 5A hydrolase [Lachnospiraceae bacterium]
MRAAIIGFTRSGCGYARRIQGELERRGFLCTAFGKCACARECQVEPVEESLRTWTGRHFRESEALIFVGATGIAVRSIAPFVKSKLADPAVLCIDEQAQFVISLLSGHVGGANELAEELARYLKAQPVITTATDLRQKFAVDVFAKKQGMTLGDKELAKEVSAALLEEQPVGLYSPFPVRGELPPGVVWCGEQFDEGKRPSLGIAISPRTDCRPFSRTLQLYPPVVVLGMGCRRDTPAKMIRELAEKALALNGISRKSVRALASLDLKKEEPGLLALAREWEIPFLTFSASELAQVEYAEELLESAFVRQVTGVGNVCERAALRTAREGVLLQRKMVENKVTVAIAQDAYELTFSRAAETGSEEPE